MVRGTGQRKLPNKGTPIESPSDSFPVMDARKRLLYFARQDSGIGVLNLDTRKVDMVDEMNGRLILTGITLCSGQWGSSYEDKNWLYFGTRRCQTKAKPTQKNPKNQEVSSKSCLFLLEKLKNKFYSVLQCITNNERMFRRSALTKWSSMIWT